MPGPPLADPITRIAAARRDGTAPARTVTNDRRPSGHEGQAKACSSCMRERLCEAGVSGDAVTGATRACHAPIQSTRASPSGSGIACLRTTIAGSRRTDRGPGDLEVQPSSRNRNVHSSARLEACDSHAGDRAVSRHGDSRAGARARAPGPLDHSHGDRRARFRDPRAGAGSGAALARGALDALHAGARLAGVAAGDRGVLSAALRHHDRLAPGHRHQRIVGRLAARARGAGRSGRSRAARRSRLPREPPFRADAER